MAQTRVDQPFGRIEKVAKTYPGGIVALSEVDYSIAQGELVALLGPSGCGKTTLLRMIAGLTRPSSGRIVIRGKEVKGPQADFGFAFQSPNLLPWRSVLNNVLFPVEIAGKADSAARDRAMELLRLVGLDAFAQVRPHQLSGGMRQRVSLCRALVNAPSLLLMDEPFGALDELTRMEMHDLLHGIRRNTGATVFFVTHSISEAVYLADEILVMSPRPGRVVERMRVDLPYPRRAEQRYSAQARALERHAGAALGVVHEDA
jgi:NitT/TauT family transport system ATP-binding protein